MQAIILIVHVVLTISLIGLILIQRGKGADIGAAFGSGASQTVFGSQGSGSFLTKSTAILATLFFITSLSLAYLSGQRIERVSVTETVTPVESSLPEFPVGFEVDQALPADVPSVPVPVPEVEEEFMP